MASMTASSVSCGQTVRCAGQSGSQRPFSRRPLRVSCAAAPDQQQQHQQPLFGLKQLAAGLAAAAILHSAPANAGVIIEKRQLKKVFQSEPVEKVKKEVSKAAPGGSGQGFKAPSVSLPSGLPNLTALSLPLAVGGIAATAFAWKQIDPEFDSFFYSGLAKDSGAIGAGYEEVIKGGNMPNRKPAAAPRKQVKKSTPGTKRIGRK